MNARPKIYLAGPDVFRPDADAIGRLLKAQCQAKGLEGIWPADTEPRKLTDDGMTAAFRIFRRNVLTISECDAVVANVMPFRGPHLDVGTAFEIGFAYAHKKPVFAYLSRPGTVAHPSKIVDRVWCMHVGNQWRDAQGDLVEDFGLFDNLMIASACRPHVSAGSETAIARAAAHLAGANTVPA